MSDHMLERLAAVLPALEVSVTPLRFSSLAISAKFGSLKSCGGRPARPNNSRSNVASSWPGGSGQHDSPASRARSK